MHTDVVQVLVRSTSVQPLEHGAAGARGDLAGAAGDEHDVGLRELCSSERSARSVSMPLSVRTGPASAATNVTVARRAGG